ncbi:MAG: response regulator containing a CheY-like receiver domain and an DNA-binding domain [Candidatus Solibacter sp.]|jgi:DNA-binding NarL/FixJ family response regulator|nr:response regulator containing a CheY-like receiver domain and an DNA-binding domain [Candidatus Solibacter sp.]
MKRATLLLADDHAIVVEGLRRVLERDFDVIGAVEDGLALVEATQRLAPDVVVVDISMPLLNGIEAARQIRAANQSAKVVFLSMHPDVVYVSEALLAGGAAYVLKSSAGFEIVTAIRLALQGKTYITPTINRTTLDAQMKRDRGACEPAGTLSPRQRGVLQMVAEGRSTKDIAVALRISPRTVEFHRYRAMESLGLRSLAELIQYAIKHRIVS